MSASRLGLSFKPCMLAAAHKAGIMLAVAEEHRESNTPEQAEFIRLKS